MACFVDKLLEIMLGTIFCSGKNGLTTALTRNESKKFPSMTPEVAFTVIVTAGLFCSVVMGSSPLGHMRREQSAPVKPQSQMQVMTLSASQLV